MTPASVAALVPTRHPKRCLDGLWRWVLCEGGCREPCHLPPAVFARLAGGEAFPAAGVRLMGYSTRAKADAALAAAYAAYLGELSQEADMTPDPAEFLEVQLYDELAAELRAGRHPNPEGLAERLPAERRAGWLELVRELAAWRAVVGPAESEGGEHD